MAIEFSNTLINAGPGTGKTEYMKNVIRQLIASGVKEDEIFGVTFSKSAALNMSERLAEFPNLLISNIHSYSINHLPDGVELISEVTFNELAEVLATTKETYYKKWGPKDVTSGMIKNLLDDWCSYWFIMLEDATLESYQDAIVNGDENQFASYYSELSNYNFNIQARLPYVLRLVKRLLMKMIEFKYVNFINALIYTYYTKPANSIKYILVDEFQDFTYLEYKCVLRVNPEAKFLLLCDTYQGIYYWRGSNFIGNLRHFKDNYNPRILKFEDNYRCSRRVLSLANKLSNRKDQPKLKELGTIADLGCQSEGQIVEFVKGRIKKYPEESLAVLTATNKMASTLTNLLKQEKFLVSHKVRNGYASFLKSSTFITMLGVRLKSFSTSALLDLITLKRNELGLDIRDIMNSAMFPITAEFLLNGGESYLMNPHNEKNQYVIFDTETTGTNTSMDDIVQLAAIKLDHNFNEIGRFNRYLATDKDLSSSQGVHNITSEFLKEYGESAVKVLDDFLEFSRGSLMVAHNTKFDKAILLNQLHRHNLLYKKSDINLQFVDWLDTLDMSRKIISKDGIPNYKLQTLVEYLNLDATPNHNAMFDVEATVELFKALPQLFREHPKYKEVFESPIYLKRKEIIALLDEVNAMTTEQVVSVASTIDDPKSDIYLTIFFDTINSLMELHFTEQDIYNYFVDRDMISSKGNVDVTVCTVHQSKGLEFDTVVYVQSHNSDDGNADKHHVENVVVSRAKKNFILVKEKPYIESTISRLINEVLKEEANIEEDSSLNTIRDNSISSASEEKNLEKGKEEAEVKAFSNTPTAQEAQRYINDALAYFM